MTVLEKGTLLPVAFFPPKGSRGVRYAGERMGLCFHKAEAHQLPYLSMKNAFIDTRSTDNVPPEDTATHSTIFQLRHTMTLVHNKKSAFSTHRVPETARQSQRGLRYASVRVDAVTTTTSFLLLVVVGSSVFHLGASPGGRRRQNQPHRLGPAALRRLLRDEAEGYEHPN